MSSDPNPLFVLHLTAGAVLGGVTRYICELCKEMSAGGHRVLAGGSPGPWRRLFADERIEWIDLPLDGGPLSLWRCAATIARTVRARGVNLIHCHFRRPVLAARLARLRGMRGVPVVYTLHLAPLPVRGLRGWLSDFGDWTIAPSQQARQWATDVAKVDAGRVHLIPHGVDLRKWTVGDDAARHEARRRFGFTPTQPVAAFVGRFETVKNEEWVLDVADECRRRGIDCGFVLCGDGPNRKTLQQRIRCDGLEDRVKLPGYTDPRHAYHAADLLLLPSWIEGFAYVAAEAAASGVAVLRTRTAGWQETVHDGVTGSVVDVDRQQFVAAAVEMLTDPARLRRMGAAGAEFARACLTLDRQIDRTLEVYRRAMAAASGRRGPPGPAVSRSDDAGIEGSA